MSRPRPLPGQRIEFLLSTREQAARPDVLTSAVLAGEGREVWGETDVWAAASGRASDHTMEQWREIAGEQSDWERRVVDLHLAGEPAGGEAAMVLAEEHRAAIERWYFTCPPLLHREVMDALLDDVSFRSRYDGLADGTADFLRAAVHASAARAASG